MSPEQLFAFWILAPILGEVIAIAVLVYIQLFPAPHAKFEALKERITLNCVIAIILIPMIFISTVAVWYPTWIDSWKHVEAIIMASDGGYSNLYAAQDIPAGVPITKDMLSVDAKRSVTPGDLLMNAFVGQRSTRTLPKGSRISVADLAPRE